MKAMMSNNPLVKSFLYLGFFITIVLAIPLVAMQFTDAVNWDKYDFIAMACLLCFFGSLIIFTLRFSKKNSILIAGIWLASFLYLWAELAVGIFTPLGS
ncbi:MAG: hypothetical protein ACPG52_13025 [Cognaticolwellia sp.]